MIEALTLMAIVMAVVTAVILGIGIMVRPWK